MKPDITNPTICNLIAQDLPEVTRIHMKAFPKSALTLLGAEGVHRYYDWQLQGPHDAVALGIFREASLAGYCFAGVFRGSLSGFLRKNKQFLAWKVLSHVWLVANPLFRQRLSSAQNILTQMRKRPSSSPPVATLRSFGILSIAVDPDLQGQGYGQQLMLAVEAVAIERGFSRLNLTVAAENKQAISFYEGVGWCKTLDAEGNWRGHMFIELPITINLESSTHQ
jgi:ribosomal protein S18 acetylase RimI-like enzyme